MPNNSLILTKTTDLQEVQSTEDYTQQETLPPISYRPVTPEGSAKKTANSSVPNFCIYVTSVGLRLGHFQVNGARTQPSSCPLSSTMNAAAYRRDPSIHRVNLCVFHGILRVRNRVSCLIVSEFVSYKYAVYLTSGVIFLCVYIVGVLSGFKTY